MTRVGRNDPCPCGSGRKYKNCCLRQDRLKDSRTLSSSQLEILTADGLVGYAFSPAFASDLIDAFHFYWGGAFVGDSAQLLEAEDLRRMVEWFAFDYRIKADGQYIVDKYIETEASKLPPEAHDVIQAWSASTMGLFRITNIVDSGQLELYDLLHGESLKVVDATLARNASQEDLLVGRLFEIEGENRLSMMTMVLPNEYEPGLTEYVRNAYRIYQEDHSDATWDEFLREYGYLFNAYLLSSQAEALRSLIGPGTRFYDPAETRDRLRAFSQERLRERLEEMRQEQESEALPSEHRTTVGIILPGAASEKEDKGRQGKEQESDKPKILIPGRDF